MLILFNKIGFNLVMVHDSWIFIPEYFLGEMSMKHKQASIILLTIGNYQPTEKHMLHVL